MTGPFCFAVPGSIEGTAIATTGGTLYDARMLCELRNLGLRVDPICLPQSFPHPSASDIATTKALLSCPCAALLIDGLAYGALPDDALGAIRVPVVALVHHPLCLETGLGADDAERLRQIERNALAKAAHIITVSTSVAKSLQTLFGVPEDKITIAPPGLDKTMAEHAYDNPYPAEAFHFLAVGAVMPRKGYDILIRGLAHAMRRGYLPQNWHLTIVGSIRDGAYRQKLQTMIMARQMAPRLRFTGALDKKQLCAHYRHADVFVSASLYEGFGMALTEAMLFGLPMIVASGGAAQETVPDGAAIKFLEGSEEALSAALRLVTGAPALMRRLAARAREEAIKMQDWKDSAALVARILKRVAP